MKSLRVTLSVLGVLLSGSSLAQQSALPVSNQSSLPAAAVSQEDSPAQQRIAAARQQLKADAKKVQAYNELTLALLRRARETADPSYLSEANDAL